ncbi:MAG: aminotransferase class I/II-fold pyridoxal phosphate-dependent enzyme [Planctomycetota bacterium]|jgi:aspartate/methionine/tyrosine aminotransferase
MTGFHPFLMERMMSKFEKKVDFNLSESGVHPVLLKDLLALGSDSIEKFLSVDLNYPHANGTPELREAVAGIYTHAAKQNILITVGAAEANYICVQTVMDQEGELVMMLPNYMQVWGIAKNFQLQVKPFYLKEENGWAPDLNQLDNIVNDKTRLIAVCNPNNPTGYILKDQEMDAIITIADRVGAWILADEVYSGAERTSNEITPSFFGRYDKVLAVGSTSKAYGLPGLRLGWVAGPPDFIDDIWARHEYVTISATMLSNHLGAIALSSGIREKLLERTRQYIKNGYDVFSEWIKNSGGMFSLVPPQASAIAFVKYKADVNSTEFVERLVRDKQVFIVPGDNFGLDGFFRISFGLPVKYLTQGLDRIQSLILEYKE